MKVLIKNGLIVCPSSPFNGKNQDILIENGLISSISEHIEGSADSIIEVEGLQVSIGWTDLFANFADPGYEFKETLESGANAAASGGFTAVAIIPNTKPVVDSKSQVEYIKQKSNLPVTILPLGAITKDAAGKDLSEMYDMLNSGAVAFTDGVSSLQTSGILLKALQYVKAFDGLIIQLPEDKTITNNGLVNEGIMSTSLGLPGKPAIAEEIMVSRDIELLRYTNSRLHITGITTGKSVERIRNAKKEGLNITCSVTPYHLFFSDSDLSDYDTNLKVNPPLREKAEVEKLRAGLKDRTIDFIASHHQPHEWDSKITEFEYAKNGMSGIETVFSVTQQLGVPTAHFIEMQTTNIRKVLKLPEGNISEGAKADLTLFVPGVSKTYESEGSRSKSRNNAFIGKPLKGKVIGIINGDKLFLNEN